MSPRPRSGLNARLPANLSLHNSGQYRYVRPDNKKHTYLGTDRAKATAAAEKLNYLLTPCEPLVDRVLQNKHKLTECIALFRDETLPERNLKPNTEREYKIHLRNLDDNLGSQPVEHLATKDYASYLRDITASSRLRRRIRSLLVGVVDCAVQEGWIDHNPVAHTKNPKPAKRQRARLTFEGFQAIRSKAEPWLRNAMDLALHTLLRRADIAAMRFEDIKDGCLYAIPRKTESNTFVHLKMKVKGDLGRVIDRCRDDIASPYLVHKLPQGLRTRKEWADEREHHTQVLPEQITRAFNRARSKTDQYKDAAHPPGFHEIRSLGGDLYRQAGWTLDQVQTLMGHNSAEMTEHYLKGHAAPWTESPAGLQLEGKR